MQKKISDIIQKNKGSYILRNLNNLFQENKNLPDNNSIQIQSSKLNQTGIYVRNTFYKKISKM